MMNESFVRGFEKEAEVFTNAESTDPKNLGTIDRYLPEGLGLASASTAGFGVGRYVGKHSGLGLGILAGLAASFPALLAGTIAGINILPKEKQIARVRANLSLKGPSPVGKENFLKELRENKII